MTCARLSRSPALLAAIGAALLVAQSGCRSAQIRAKEAAVVRWKLARAGVKQRLADQMLSSGQFETAASEARRARALDPQNPELALLEARVSLARGRSDDAEPLLESVKADSSVAAEALYLRGAIAQQEQHWEKARALFASAADAERENLTYFLALVEADLRSGDTVTALRRIDEKRVLFSHDAGFHAAEAECRELAGDWDGACSAWRKTVDATDNIEDQRRLSRCLMAADRDAEAVDVLRELVPAGSADDRLLLAEALLKLGNVREAASEALAIT